MIIINEIRADILVSLLTILYSILQSVLYVRNVIVLICITEYIFAVKLIFLLPGEIS